MISSAGNLIAPAVLSDSSGKELQPGELVTLDMVQAYERETGVQVGKGEIALINFGWMHLLAHGQPKRLVREKFTRNPRRRDHLF